MVQHPPNWIEDQIASDVDLLQLQFILIEKLFYIKWVLFSVFVDWRDGWVDLNGNIMTLLWLYEYWDVHIVLFTVYIVYDIVDAHFINAIRMEDTEHETEFRKRVYGKFAKKRHMTPIDVYNETIETLKHISDDYSTSSLSCNNT